MRVNKPQNTQPLYSQSTKIKTPNPKYEGTKIFTLKDLDKEVGGIDNKFKGYGGNKTNGFKTDNLAVHDFINENIDSLDFDELKNLTINGHKAHTNHIDIKEATPNTKSKNNPNNKTNKKSDNKSKNQIKSENNLSDEKERKDPNQLMKDFEDRNKHFEERRKAKQKRLDDEMKRVCSFKPQINKKSAMLDKQRNNSPNKIPRQDNLYELNAVLRERKGELKEIIEMERYERYGAQEDKECTFKPKINDNRSPVENSDKDIAERNQAWEKKKQEKLQKIAEVKKEKELVGCTFKPQINKDD